MVAHSIFSVAIFYCAFSAWFGIVLAGAHGVTFLFPTSGLTLNYMDTINVSWTSNFSSPKLFTFCRNSSNSNDLLTKEIVDVKPYNASQLVVLNYLDVSSCYFNLRPNSSAGYGANSYSVKVLTGQRSQTTIGLAGSTASGTALSESPATATVTALVTDTGSSNQDKTGTSGLSTGAKAGIGVGVTLGVLAAGTAAAFLLLRRRRHKNQILSKVASLDTSQEWQNGNEEQAQYQYVKPHAQGSSELVGDVATELPERGVYEIGGETRPVEIDGREKRPPG